MRSVEKFNFALGNRFSTYATYAIQRHFFRISHKSRQYRNRFASDDEPVKDRAEKDPITNRVLLTKSTILRHSFLSSLQLESREQQIVLARFGFNGDKPKTFRQLGLKWESAKNEFVKFKHGRLQSCVRWLEEANPRTHHW